MRIRTFSFIAAASAFVMSACLLLCPQLLWADSMRLLSDLEYFVTENTTTTKATGEVEKSETATFRQIYNLDLQKELLPNLSLNGGGSYIDYSDRSKSHLNGVKSDASDSRETTISPYVELQLNADLLDGATSYRKSSRKQGVPGTGTSKRHIEEYINYLNWRPVGLPEVDLSYTRTLGYNDPLPNEQEIDRETDIYQLHSRYDYRNYHFDYIHTTNESRNKVSDFKNTSYSDIGLVRYNDAFYQGDVTVNGSLRYKRDELEFSGEGARRTDVNAVDSFYNDDDFNPISSPIGAPFPAAGVPLLIPIAAPPNQISFGLNFGQISSVDTLLVVVDDLTNYDEAQFQWQIYVRDFITEDWTDITPGPPALKPDDSEQEEANTLIFSFPQVETRYIKIVTREVASNDQLNALSIRAQRTLPADTSDFTSTDVTTTWNLNWKMNSKTTSGYDFVYREERSDPFDEKKTLLSTGANLNHIFNRIFVGSMRASRAAVTERGKADRVGYIFSTSLAANYLDTFDQVLTYSLTYRDDDELGTGNTNAILLRNNLDLYDGWSLNLDSSYTWQDPAEGEKTNSTFIRLGSNVIPNRWMNFSLFYDVRWTDTDGKSQLREQTGQLFASWVPYASLSFSTDLLITERTQGDESETFNRQQYYVNWSPFRDGTLQLSIAYSVDNDTNGTDSSAFSPSLRWKINKKAQLICDYSIGERESDTESTDFETTRVSLRVFY